MPGNRTRPISRTYIQHPPFFDEIAGPLPVIEDVRDARVLALLGDSVTTDHISPAGNIKVDSPAGRYLREQGVEPRDFNSYGSRRGNHEVMMRGTFANIRIRNEMLGGEEGGNTLHVPSGEKLAIYDAAMRYQTEGTPLVVIAGQEYRSNLVGMGVLPLQFKAGQNRKTLQLTGRETLSIEGLAGVELQPRMNLDLIIRHEEGHSQKIEVLCRIDTLNEVEYFKSGGILHYVLRQLIAG